MPLFGGCIPLWNWLSDGRIPLLFPVVFGFFGGLLTVAGLCTLANSLHVRVNRQGITATRRVYGIPFTKTLAAGAITALEKVIGGKTRQLPIEARTATVGDTLASASQAEYVIDKIRA